MSINICHLHEWGCVTAGGRRLDSEKELNKTRTVILKHSMKSELLYKMQGNFVDSFQENIAIITKAVVRWHIKRNSVIPIYLFHQRLVNYLNTESDISCVETPFLPPRICCLTQPVKLHIIAYHFQEFHTEYLWLFNNINHKSL